MADASILDLIANEVGVAVQPTAPTSFATVGTSAVELMNQNPQRVSFVFINLSANDMYIAPNETVASTTGILVSKSGGQASAMWKEDLVLPALKWSVIATGSSSAYILLEVIIV